MQCWVTCRLEGHGHGFRPQHHQECDDGTHCLLEALATYIPRENFFLNSKQPGNWKHCPVSFRTGVRCPLSLPSRTVRSLLMCLHFKKCTPRGTWRSSEEFTDTTSERTLRQPQPRHSWNGWPSKAAAYLWQRVEDPRTGPDTPASCILGLTEALACGRTFSFLGWTCQAL